ncbi:MAG: DUF3575 domain-containing protein [Alistipes sp.]|jgi:hypothetical protein|nr:DUF3575 domain-containing protein [Alistipes sp.]
MKMLKRMVAGKMVFLLGACFFLAAMTNITSAQVSGQAQSAQARMSLADGNVTLAEFFGEIRRQTGTIVIFDAGNVAPQSTVALPTGERTVVELLDRALPKSEYAWRVIGTYVVVRTLPAASAAIPAGPTQEEFERDVAEYSRLNLGRRESDTAVRYDTVRTERPHSGVFDYPGRALTAVPTDRAVQTPLERTTPPVLAVKTNLVWWAARGTMNVGGELGLGRRTSFELSGGINRWGLDSGSGSRKLTHWIVKPEFRYWLCERFDGHFFGLHALYGQYNVGGYDVPLLFEKEYRYEGDAWGAGVNYGYHLPLARRWGVEFTAGIGVARLDYDRYGCATCGDLLGRETKTYFGPTELGVKLIFMLR